MDGEASPVSGSSVSPAPKRCIGCQKKYKSCSCKTCSKCGAQFQKYLTGAVKGRSHCRNCGQAVCLICHSLVGGRKVCTRCHLKQKEEEISTEKALSAIGEAKYGDKKVDFPTYAKLKFGDSRKDSLFEAAKKGDDHIMVTILDMGLSVNSKDSDDSTALFYAAEGGHLTCVALLLERGANVRCMNKYSWTPLHAVAWKGSSDSHVECAEMLLEMGADVLAESETNETAADIAERCDGKKEIIQLLRAAEVDTSVKELRGKMETILTTGLKERRFCRMLTAVLNFVSSSQMNNQFPIQGATKILLPPDNLVKTSSFDKASSKKNSCPHCGRGSPNISTRRFGGSMDLLRPKADAETILRDSTGATVNSEKLTLSQEAIDQSHPLAAKLVKCEAERKDWEARSRKLMQSIATSSKEHKKKIVDLELQIQQLQGEKESEIKKIEAAYANKVAIVRREADDCMREARALLVEAEEEQKDLIHIQSTYKLTWVPDTVVTMCQNYKCRAPFSCTMRKHHCRCCGRVFCGQCCATKSKLALFGYDRPVRMCNTCFALVDEGVVDQSTSSLHNCTI